MNTVYLNGTPIGSTFTDSQNYSFSVNLLIGNETTPSNNAAFGGQLYNFEWLRGVAKYTSSFTPSINIPSDPSSYLLILNGSYSGGTESGSVTNSNVGTSSNVPTPPVPPVPPTPTPTPTNTNIYSRRISSTSFGSFWYGKGTNFPGFFFKKNTGVGGRRSTKFAAGGNSTCNTYQNVNNKYVSGSGVNGSVSSTNYAIRRRMIRNASNCVNNNCSINYFYLGYPLTYQASSVPSPIGDLICSKNNTTSGGFPVGGDITKDMDNETYDDRIDPLDFPEFFPGMAPFSNGNIVAGDKDSGDRLVGSYWYDWGDDVFDRWGWFYLYDINSGKYYFPLINPQNLSNGVITTQTFNAFGRTFTIKQGYPVQGIFKFDISVNDDLPFRFGAYGNVGSDSHGEHYDLTYPYTINSTNLTLYYQQNIDINYPETEVLYSYWIPKRVSQNNAKTYTVTYAEDDDMSAVSNSVNNGLLVYFAKTNDVKLWVVNDLQLNCNENATVPSAPRNVSATSGNVSAIVTFTAPASDGGCSISSYRVTSNPDNIIVTGTSSPITITGLTAETAYTFTVIATNCVGNSPSSSASNSVTPTVGVPTAPTISNASESSGQVTLDFTEPSSDGGSSILTYTITSSPGGLTNTISYPASSITLTGLTNNTSYTFTLIATNAIGDSPADTSNPITPLPDGSTIDSFTTVGTTTWTAPATTNSITYWVVGGGGGGGAAFDNGGAGGGGGGMVLSGTMSVTPGTTYTIVVGDGGAGGIGTGVSPTARTETDGSVGGNSSFDTIVALGGGYGYKSRGNSGTSAAGGTQVSGSSTASTGGSGGGGGRGGGGGGGESSNGSNGAAFNSSGSAGGSGGAGVSNSITGTSVTYGAGGDGGSSNSGSNGPDPTVFNLGNGGHGGGSYSGNSKSGRDGDAGVVIISYEY